MVALLAASLVLTYSVVVALLPARRSTDWQDEMAVFLLVGATFLCGACVQSMRGHIGIEAVGGAAAAARRTLAPGRWSTCVSLAFCVFFAWKSWTLLHEAWVDGQTSAIVLGAAALDPLRR